MLISWTVKTLSVVSSNWSAFYLIICNFCVPVLILPLQRAVSGENNFIWKHSPDFRVAVGLRFVPTLNRFRVNRDFYVVIQCVTWFEALDDVTYRKWRHKTIAWQYLLINFQYRTCFVSIVYRPPVLGRFSTFSKGGLRSSVASERIKPEITL